MSLHSLSITVLLTSLVLPLLISRSYSLETNFNASQAPDGDLLEFTLNLEFLEAEFFLNGALNRGLDDFAPQLAMGGPPPIGAQMANLDLLTKDVVAQFGFQEIGHLRAIKSKVKGIARPLLNISKQVFAEVMNKAFGRPLNPPFDPYVNSINYLLASYLIPYVGLTGLVEISPMLQSVAFRTLVAGLLGVEAGQDAIIRSMLYERRHFLVNPYNVTVADFTNRISNLRNKLGNEGIKDEGLVVPPSQGAEGKVSGNVLAADKDSLSYSWNVQEILRILYGGSERVPGSFYPNGANGRVANSYSKAT